MDKHFTMVIFRVYKRDFNKGEIIVLFPCTLYDDHVGCYSHIGHYDVCSYDQIIRQTRPATPEEAMELADELKAIGYRLASRRRRSSLANTRKWLAAGNL